MKNPRTFYRVQHPGPSSHADRPTKTGPPRAAQLASSPNSNRPIGLFLSCSSRASPTCTSSYFLAAHQAFYPPCTRPGSLRSRYRHADSPPHVTTHSPSSGYFSPASPMLACFPLPSNDPLCWPALKRPSHARALTSPSSTMLQLHASDHFGSSMLHVTSQRPTRKNRTGRAAKPATLLLPHANLQ